MTALATCPICSEQIESPAAFALHVAACTTLPVDAPTATAATSATSATSGPVTAAALAAAALATPTASCPTCHMVYTSELAPHEILFHEEECDRVNEDTGPVAPVRLDANGELSGHGGGSASGSANGPTGGSSGRPMSGGKRSRESAAATASASAASAAGPQVTLFPAHCAVCDAGGRTLLHCAGSCARSFHPTCIEEINVARDFAANGTAAMVGAGASSAGSAPSASGGGSAAAAGGNVSFASAITRDKKAQKAWVCGECTRGLHTCQLCGFLGHEGHEIVGCSLPDCGLFFHPACLRAQNHRAQSPLICPRHTCTACLVIETDMTRCSSCTKCCKSIHVRCRDAAGNTTTSQTRGRGDVLDPNFHVCEAHAPATGGASTLITPERKAAQYVGLKMQCRPGDLVLILEYGNLLLPSTAKEMAPDAYNHWGVVQRVENLGDGISSAWWTQLLTVTLFSDNSSISVPNRYVLPVGSMRQYSSPTLMVRDAIKWHAMSEIHVRHVEKQRSGATAPVVASTVPQAGLLVSIVLAFKERASALGVSTTDCLASAGDGFAAWQRFSTASSPTYLATSAPVYIALDTRGSTKPDMEEGAVMESTARLTRGPHEATGGDDDVDMEDASTSNLSDQGASSSSGSAFASAGGKSRAASTEPRHGHVTATVVEVVARLLEGVEALHSRGRLLGGSSDPATTVRKDSLKDIVTSMADDDDEDEVMVVDLPLLHDAGGNADVQYSENRLSMDDILNPLSQESLTWSQSAAQSPPWQYASPTSCSSPPNFLSKKEEKSKITEPVVEVTFQTQKRALEPTDDDSLDASDVMAKMSEDVHKIPEHVTKKMKVEYDVKPAIAVNFSHLPLNLKKPRNSVFGRAPLPVRPALLHKEKVAAEYPSVVLRDLQRKVDAFFDAEDMHDQRHSKGPSSVRPAFYRPTPFLYRSVRIGRRVDSISRVLLCQDKRKLKCFVQVSTSSHPSASKPSKGMRTCPYDTNRNNRLSYISVDLLGISSFPALEKQVRSRVVSAVATKERSMGWLSQSLNDTSVAVEDHAGEPEVRLSYCAYDGSELALPAHKALRQQQPEWLCFCANVVHLTATVIQHC